MTCAMWRPPLDDLTNLSCERMAKDPTVFSDIPSCSMLLFLLQTALACQKPANNQNKYPFMMSYCCLTINKIINTSPTSLKTDITAVRHIGCAMHRRPIVTCRILSFTDKIQSCNIIWSLWVTNFNLHIWQHVIIHLRSKI